MPLTDPLSSLVTALKRESLVPDVLPESFYPSLLLSITFPSGKEVLMGNELTVEETSEEPEIRFTPMVVPDVEGNLQGGADALDASYTLVMTDPDAPTRSDPIYRQFRHWVITGIKLSAPTAEVADSPPALKTKAATTPFRPPGPRPNSGVHRYTFLLFQEPTADDFTVPLGAKEYGAQLEERRSWDAVKFGEEYGLKLVGANFFLVHSSSQ